MKLIHNTQVIISISMVVIFLVPIFSWSQKRINPPKRVSKVESVDLFVNHSFTLYHKVFVYDSLTKAGVDIPVELEDQLTESIERDIDSLYQVVPDLIDDISDAPFMRQAKATLNLNRSKKALKYCMTTVKAYVLGTEEEDEDDN